MIRAENKKEESLVRFQYVGLLFLCVVLNACRTGFLPDDDDVDMPLYPDSPSELSSLINENIRPLVEKFYTKAKKSSQPISIDLDKFPRLKDHFSDELLRSVRLIPVGENPMLSLTPFSGLLETLRIDKKKYVIDPSAMTFGTEVFIRSEYLADSADQKELESVIIHELVHVVQYRYLGKAQFVSLYYEFLFLNGYRDNPFEKVARVFEKSYMNRDLGKGQLLEPRIENTMASVLEYRKLTDGKR